jgi:hypothetical protein
VHLPDTGSPITVATIDSQRVSRAAEIDAAQPAPGVEREQSVSVAAGRDPMERFLGTL